MTTLCENAVDEKVQCFTAKFESLHQAFGTSEVSIDELIRRIGVQPSAVCRRTDGVTRGSKGLASGRPVLGTKRASMRPRSLANAISHNQPNAKSHGSGH
jgi:hypothetical protein